MELINKIKTFALSGLAVGSGGALYGYCSAPNVEENKTLTKAKKRPRPIPSGPAYENCLKSDKITQGKHKVVCGWLYRGL